MPTTSSRSLAAGHQVPKAELQSPLSSLLLFHRQTSKLIRLTVSANIYCSDQEKSSETEITLQFTTTALASLNLNRVTLLYYNTPPSNLTKQSQIRQHDSRKHCPVQSLLQGRRGGLHHLRRLPKGSRSLERGPLDPACTGRLGLQDHDISQVCLPQLTLNIMERSLT
jgi:hypothetical protein